MLKTPRYGGTKGSTDRFECKEFIGTSAKESLMKRTIERKFLDISDAVGLGPQLVSAYDAATGMADFDVDPEIQSYSLPDEKVKGHVLFPVIEGDNKNAYRYYILAHAFRCRGYRPIVPLCDADLGLCMRKAADWLSDAVCNVCHHYGAEMANAFGVDTVPLAELIPDGKEYDLERYSEPNPKHYRDINVSGFAKASTRKHFRKYHVDDTGIERERYLQFIETGCELVDAMNELFDRHDIQTAFANDAVYVYGGIPLAVADKRGIVAYSHGRGYRDGTVQFGRTSNRSVLQPFTEYDHLCRIMDVPLTETQRERAEEIMAGRKSGEGVRHQYTPATSDSVKDDGKVVAGMFTNLIWDASLEGDKTPFSDSFEWITDTIAWFVDHSDSQLIIKPHPAEAKRGTNESVADWIHDRYGKLPENISILSPDTSVNTYQMLDDIDVALVFTSTVGLEMAYNGGATIVAGDTHYRGLGFTYDATSREEYQSLLDQMDGFEVEEETTIRARRYIFHLYVRNHIDFPYYRTDPDSFEIELCPVSHSELLPGKEPFDTICSRSLNGEPILMPDI